MLTAHYLAPGTSLAAVGAQMGVSGTTVMRWEREACRAARRLLSAERTELPSISRARPPGASSCASQARSVARTGRGARSDP
ncbi:hypothetical protein [Tessaracoccus coleopterorum]|uniref:hypothetical protein n=1 Tax=Tessaracoccus coleopterorum TaxID=2714950 RepID=UPI0038CDB7CF